MDRNGTRAVFAPVPGLAWGMLACVLLAACGRQDASAGDVGPARASSTAADAKGEGFPPLYVDRVLESVTDGRNEHRDGYRKRLELCQEAGIPTTPLGSDEEELAGTERWRLWRSNTHLVLRSESWMAVTPQDEASREAMCRFSLDHRGTHVYTDAERTVTIDLATGERSEGPGNPHIAMERVADADAGKAHAVARQAGMQGPSRMTVLGQPCDRWVAPDGGAVCVWAGGLPWGLTSEADGPFLLTSDISELYIVLESEPPAEGYGARLETRSIEFGTPFDIADLLPDQGGK